MRRHGSLIPDTFGLVLPGAVLAMLPFGACSAGASPTAAPGSIVDKWGLADAVKLPR